MHSLYLAINELEPIALTFDEQGVDVVTLQTALRLLGCYSGEIDGHYGVKTRAAVKAVQEYFELSATGIFDTKVWYMLSSWNASPEKMMQAFI
ncbi:MAG: peptidoglycan-binding protein [Oscillatoriales cyanobacterium]|jgi:peptidoglycan hydrolase-like protein with peptidoglycan-binding domain|nr:MAG: peptidoglycan-binding protein [Oscillatoriales cyanobacterium]